MANFFSWIANGLMLEAMSAHKFFALLLAFLMFGFLFYCIVKIIYSIVKKIKNKTSGSSNYKKSKRGG